jgi:hypothetical protein
MYTTNINDELIPNSLYILAKSYSLFSLASLKLQITLSNYTRTDDENRVISVDNGYITILYADNSVMIMINTEFDLTIEIIYANRGLPISCNIDSKNTKRTIKFEYSENDNDVIVTSYEYNGDTLDVIHKSKLTATKWKNSKSKHIEYDIDEPFYVHDLFRDVETYTIT